jgi:glycosyltransferase involved in cell wall biosynthesis
LCEPGNVQELTGAILASLSREWDSSLISAYAKQFTWETVTQEILGVYADVCKKEL